MTTELADWLDVKKRDDSHIGKITYHLVGRVALLGASLVSLVESIGRIALCCLSFFVLLITFGQWDRMAEFGGEQLRKGGFAGIASFNCLAALISPSDLSRRLQNASPTPKTPVPPQVATPLVPQKIATPAAPLNAEMRENRIRVGADLIQAKLRKEFACAQNQAAAETDGAFQYLAAPADFPGHTEEEQVPGYQVGVCHYIGRRPSMEDEHLATSFHLNIQGRDYPLQLFGVFDGHGGPQTSLYVKQNLQRKLQETLPRFCPNGLTEEGIWNALKMTFVELNKELPNHRAGSTATVALMLDGKLWTANVGDSRTILDNGIQLSEDAKPNDPRYLKGIVNRGGVVFFNRINGNLGVGRAVGDHMVGAVSARPKITVYPLATIQPGSHLILTCDGIYDVASTRQVAGAVRAHAQESAMTLAKNIVYSAYQAQSGDNLSALVVKFPG